MYVCMYIPNSVLHKWYEKVKVSQSCPTLCHPTDYTAHGILQAIAFLFSREIFPTQGSNPALPHCRRVLYQLSQKGSPRILGCLVKSSFSSSHVRMWKLGHKESWAPKNGCFWTVVLEKTLQSPLDCKEIQPVNPKGNQSCIFIGRTDAETPLLWPPDMKNWLIWKDPDAGKDWRQEKGTTEGEMVGWHHQLNGPEFEQTPGVGYGQECLVCCNPWGCRVDWATELNWRIPEWVAYLFSSGSALHRNPTGISCIAAGFFPNWIIREVW